MQLCHHNHNKEKVGHGGQERDKQKHAALHFVEVSDLQNKLIENKGEEPMRG
jgi:hypothetical protein